MAAAAAAAAAVAGDGFTVGKEDGQPGAEGEGSRGLASSSPGGGVEIVAVPESAAASSLAAAAAADADATAAGGLGHATVSEEQLNASMCNEVDNWKAVNGGGGGVPEEEAAPLQPQEDGDPGRNTGSGISIPEAQTNLSTSGASAVAAMTAAAAAAAVGGEEDGAEQPTDQAAATSVRGRGGEGIRIGAGVEDRSASVEVLPQAPTAPVIAKEVRVEAVEESSGPRATAEVGAVPISTATPLLGIGAAASVENPLESGRSSADPDRCAPAETVPSRAVASKTGLEPGLNEESPPMEETHAGTVGVAVLESPADAAAATTAPPASASPSSEVPITSASALQAAGRNSVDVVEEPQPAPPPPPPPPAAASTSTSVTAAAAAAAAGDTVIGTCPASDGPKEDVPAGDMVGSEQSLSAQGVLSEAASASADAVRDRETALASTAGSGKEKAAAAKAAAEAATTAAVLASADAASKGAVFAPLF